MSEIDLNLEKHYEISLNTTPDLYNYDSCQTENIPLFGHQELPQGYKFIDPRLSQDEKYLSSIAKGKETDIDYIYMWRMDNLDSFLYKCDAKGKIEGIEFAPNNKSFVIIYNQEPPVHYNIESGKKIVIFKPTGDPQSQALSFSFSSKSRYFGLATENHFTVWDALTGKVVEQFNEISPYKIIRNDTLISIQNNLNVRVINFSNKVVRKSFQIKNLNSVDLILSSIVSPNGNFIYALKDGIYEMNLENGNVDKIIEFEANNVIISDDCKNAVSTDFTNVIFWNLEDKNKIGIIYKEEFHSFTVNFEKEKLITSNEICINIETYNSNEPNNKFIWLNLNTDKFNYFTFSPDQKVILGIMDEHNAILYNCETGRIIKKFHNKLPDWAIACEIVPENSEIAVIATKYNENIIKIWNYFNGWEIFNLEGYNTHSFSFSAKGNLLACGAENGNEIARVWDLNSDDNFHFGYTYNGTNNNSKTLVYLTKKDDDKEKLICCSSKQNPVVFDLETKNLLFECNCPYIFEKVDDIQCDLDCNFFFVKGTDENGISNAALFNLSNGELIEQYDNCFNIDFGKSGKLLLSRSTNINDNKLVISNFDDLNDIKRISCELDAEMSNFIQDNKVIVSAFGKEKKTDFILSDVNTGKMIAELKYVQKVRTNAEIDLSANQVDNTLVFRYIEFINPERK